MTTFEVTVPGTRIRVRAGGTPEASLALEKAIGEVESYVQSIQQATGLAEMREILLVALLNNTMEMNQMKVDVERSSNEGESFVRWARELNASIRAQLA